MPKVYKTCIYSKIIKSFDSEKSQNLHILKKIKKIKNQVIYASGFHIESEIFDFLIFLSICRFGDFSLSKLLIFVSICRCCALLASKCCFFDYMQVMCTPSKIMHFLLLMQVLERYKLQNLQMVCNFEVNKAQMKNGNVLCFSFYFILLKNNDHQNKTNRMCIKHGNLQCFLSMSLNAFNTTLGK